MSDNLSTPTERLLAALDPRVDVDRGLAVTIAHDLADDAQTVLAELIGKTVARARADAYQSLNVGRDDLQSPALGAAPIRVSVRLLGDDDPRPASPAHVVFAGEAGREHRLAVAPDATDAELGQALRQVIAYELAARDADLAGRTPEQRRAGMRSVDE